MVLTMAARIMWVVMAILMVVIALLLFIAVPNSSTPRGSSERERQITAQP